MWGIYHTRTRLKTTKKKDIDPEREKEYAYGVIKKPKGA